jgi:hypothetical protein
MYRPMMVTALIQPTSIFTSNTSTLSLSMIRTAPSTVLSRKFVSAAHVALPSFHSVRSFASNIVHLPTDTVTVKAERTFHPTKESIQRLRANDGSPTFKNIQQIGVQTYDDIYYDRDQQLWVLECIFPHYNFVSAEKKSFMAKGIRIRERNGKLQGRTHCGGTRKHPGSVVPEGDDKVHEYLKEVLDPPLRFEDLEEVLHMDRKREE